MDLGSRLHRRRTDPRSPFSMPLAVATYQKNVVRNSARFAGSDKLLFTVGTVDLTTSVVFVKWGLS